MALEFQMELEFRNAGFLGEEKTGVSHSKERSNQQQTQPTWDVKPGPNCHSIALLSFYRCAFFINNAIIQNLPLSNTFCDYTFVCLFA